MTVMVTVDGAASAAASAAAADDDDDGDFDGDYDDDDYDDADDHDQDVSPLVTRDILLEISLDVYHRRWIISHSYAKFSRG
jgi:hypothetical protein